MTTNKHQQDNLDLKQQTEQARRVLMRLQWLMIILLASGIVWLYVSFESVVTRVDNKLAIIDNVDTRLNNIDDRLFALTPNQTTAKASISNTSKDSELFYIQLLLANQLFRQGNFDDTLITLQAIQWQLTQNNNMAAPIKATLQESLKHDIAYVSALKNQPDAWQTHIIKMRDVQSFLRSQQNNAIASPLNRGDILLHDATMLLSLAIGSATVRDRDQMTGYLQEVKSQLETYLRLNTQHSQATQQNKTENKPEHSKDKDNNIPTLQSLDDAVYWINNLLANTPKNKSLQSTQILQNRHK